MRRLGVVGVAVVCASCLPTHVAVTNHDTVLSEHEIDADRTPATLQVHAESTSTALTLTAENVVSCTRESRRKVRRVAKTERRTNHVVHGLLYFTGLAVGAFGGIVINDTRLSVTADDRTIKIGDTKDASTQFGIGMAVAGGLMFVYALGSSMHAVDVVEHSTVELPVAGTRHVVECDRKPASGESLGLLFAGTDDRSAFVPLVPLGATDGQGKLIATWSALSPKIPASAQRVARVVAGTPATVERALTDKTALVTLATVLRSDEDPESAWTAAVTANTAAAFKSYHDRFPASPHAADALARAQEATGREATQRFETAMAAGDYDGAGKALDAMRGAADATAVSAAEARLATARHADLVKQAREQLPALLAGLADASDPAQALLAIKASIDELRIDSPEEAATADTRVVEARKRAAARRIANGQQAYAKRELARGNAEFDLAAVLAVDAATVDKARRAARDKVVRSVREQAAALGRAGRYEEAIARLDEIIAVVPDDKRLAAERVRWDDANQRALRVKAERQARDEAREQARLQREEAARAAEAARKDAAEQARIARAEAARRDEEARAERARAREEAKARDEAARRDRQAEVQRLAEQRRQEAEAKKAEAARVAAEAARQREEARRAQEARRLDAEAARKLEAARRAEAEAQRARDAASKAALASTTVQYELPAGLAALDVLKTVTTPAKCTATAANFSAKSTFCKGAACKPTPMSRRDVVCEMPEGKQAFAFIQDGTHVWLTCTGPLVQCGFCTEVGKDALRSAAAKPTIKTITCR